MKCSDARRRSTNDATSSGWRTNAARTTSAITERSASHSGRMTTPSATGDDGRRARRLWAVRVTFPNARPGRSDTQWMQIGVVYPQTELRGDPAAVRGIGLAVERL